MISIGTRHVQSALVSQSPGPHGPLRAELLIDESLSPSPVPGASCPMPPKGLSRLLPVVAICSMADAETLGELYTHFMLQGQLPTRSNN